MDLVGIEPTTSSMPWKRAPKLRHRPTMLRRCNFSIFSACARFVNVAKVYHSRKSAGWCGKRGPDRKGDREVGQEAGLFQSSGLREQFRGGSVSN